MVAPTAEPAPLEIPDRQLEVAEEFSAAMISILVGTCFSRIEAVTDYFRAYWRVFRSAGILNQRGACLLHASNMCQPNSSFIQSVGQSTPCNFVSSLFDSQVASRSCYLQAQVGCSICDY